MKFDFEAISKAANKMTAKQTKRRRNDMQSAAANALAALTRGVKKKESAAVARKNLREAALVMDAKPNGTGDAVREGHVCDVILITEGLGNRRNMNYYGPEAIASAPLIFEGKPCFLDHPSENEERDIPERRVRQKCGYFKNCRVETMEGGATACVGELHFDLSEDGEQAFNKARTSLHYRQEFPGLDSEYVGLSINADGDWEERTVEWQGETLQVNYVTRFRDAMSCDIVTSPARGGRFLALVESAAGAKQTKEESPMKKGLKKALETARAAIEKAKDEKDFEAMKKATAEANRLFQEFLKEASKGAQESEDETESESGMKCDSESEDSEDEDGAESEDSHTVTTHKIVKKTGKAAVQDEADDAGKKTDDGDDDDAKESKRIAITAMAKEAGLELPKGKLERLALLSMKEAKAEIADLKWFQESTVKKVLKQTNVPIAGLPKLTESSRDNGSNEDDLLASCVL